MKALHWLERIFPARLDNTFRGHRVALGMLVAFVLLKLIMSTNSLLNTRSVAVGADGMALDALPAHGAQLVLMLFALVALGQLALTLLGALVLARYRAMVPLMYLVLLAEHLARRLVIFAYDVPRTEGTPVGFYINLALSVVLLLGFVLSVTGSGYRTATARN